MEIYTSEYNGDKCTFNLIDRGNYKLIISGGSMWSDLYSSIGANNVLWHINKSEYKRLVKLYDKLYSLYNNLQHELWIKNNSPMRFKVSYKEKNKGYNYLHIDNNKLINKLEKVINRLKNISNKKGI